MNASTQGSFPFMMRGAMAVNPAAGADALNMLTQGAQFFSMRLDMNLKAQKDLLACTTPAEVYKVQTEYLQTAFEHYSMAAQGMMDLWGDMMRDVAKSAAREYDDVPV